jgi:hypothetical protein
MVVDTTFLQSNLTYKKNYAQAIVPVHNFSQLVSAIMLV